MATTQPAELGSIIDAAPWSPFQRFAVALAMVAVVIDGIATQIFGLAIPAIMDEWSVGREAFALPTAMGFVGMALGAYFAGTAGDRIGRRWMIILSVAMFGIGTLVSAYASTLGMLSVLRLIAGCGLGGALPNAMSLIADMTPARKRVIAVSSGSLGMPIGNALCGVIAAIVLPLYSWQGLMLTGGVIALAAAGVLVAILPESPRILQNNPARTGALQSLLRRMNIATPVEDLAPAPAQIRAGGSIKSLLVQAVRRDSIALWLSFTFTMLVLYSLVSWAPTLIKQQGYAPSVTGQSMAAFGFGSILGGLVLGAAVSRWGTRVPLVATALLGLATAIFLAVNGFRFVAGASAPVIALAVMGFLISGVQNTLYVMGVHIYPPHLRAGGLGTALAIGRIGAIASSFTGAFSLAVGGASAFFMVLAIVFGGIVVALLTFANHVPSRQSIR